MKTLPFAPLHPSGGREPAPDWIRGRDPSRKLWEGEAGVDTVEVVDLCLQSADARDRAPQVGGEAGRRVGCPTLLLESTGDDLDIHGDPAAIWEPWLDRPLRHRQIGSGHHQAEEAPDEVAAALREFLAGADAPAA